MGLDWAIPQNIARKQVRNGKRCYVKLWYMCEVSAVFLSTNLPRHLQYRSGILRILFRENNCCSTPRNACSKVIIRGYHRWHLDCGHEIDICLLWTAATDENFHTQPVKFGTGNLFGLKLTFGQVDFQSSA